MSDGKHPLFGKSNSPCRTIYVDNQSYDVKRTEEHHYILLDDVRDIDALTSVGFLLAEDDQADVTIETLNGAVWEFKKQDKTSEETQI